MIRRRFCAATAVQAHRRLGEFHRRLRLGDAQPGGLHGRRILQRPIDQHIELRVIVGLPPAGCRPVAVRQVDHLRQLGLLRIDDGDLGRAEYGREEGETNP